jgi:hypothetical protein
LYKLLKKVPKLFNFENIKIMWVQVTFCKKIHDLNMIPSSSCQFIVVH